MAVDIVMGRNQDERQWYAPPKLRGHAIDHHSDATPRQPGERDRRQAPMGHASGPSGPRGLRIEQAGTALAFPSQTLYLGRDRGNDPVKAKDAEASVQEWRDKR
jgi:hypothetical protein